MAVRDRFEERLDSLAKRYGLTEREKDITKLIAQGNTVKKTAALLYVSPGTVQSHMKNIYRKLDVHSRQEVIDMCHQDDHTVS
nr:LuxR C-terminal-related transcriptional regulator [Slackia exigua]